MLSVLLGRGGGRGKGGKGAGLCSVNKCRGYIRGDIDVGLRAFLLRTVQTAASAYRGFLDMVLVPIDLPSQPPRSSCMHVSLLPSIKGGSLAT